MQWAKLYFDRKRSATKTLFLIQSSFPPSALFVTSSSLWLAGILASDWSEYWPLIGQDHVTPRSELEHTWITEITKSRFLLFCKAIERVSENDTSRGLRALRTWNLAPNRWAADGGYRSADGVYNCWVSLCTKVKYCKHVQCSAVLHTLEYYFKLHHITFC